MYSGKMTGDAAYESEPEVEDDSYVDASQPSAPAAKVNIVPTKGAMRFKRHSRSTPTDLPGAPSLRHDSQLERGQAPGDRALQVEL